jgi:hypothetical protein
MHASETKNLLFLWSMTLATNRSMLLLIEPSPDGYDKVLLHLGRYMDSKVKLILSEEGLRPSELNALTREVAMKLNASELIAYIPEQKSGTGTKGNPTEVGTIVLQLLGSGGAIAVLLGGLKAYLIRKQKLKFTFVLENGTTATIDAENLSEGNLQATLRHLNSLFGKKPDAE